nr:hypothetical protein [Rhizobium smilacinae]
MVPVNSKNLIVIRRIQILRSDTFVRRLRMQPHSRPRRIMLTGGDKDDAAGFKHAFQFLGKFRIGIAGGSFRIAKGLGGDPCRFSEVFYRNPDQRSGSAQL